MYSTTTIPQKCIILLCLLCRTKFLETFFSYFFTTCTVQHKLVKVSVQLDCFETLYKLLSRALPLQLASIGNVSVPASVTKAAAPTLKATDCLQPLMYCSVVVITVQYLVQSQPFLNCKSCCTSSFNMDVYILRSTLIHLNPIPIPKYFLSVIRYFCFVWVDRVLLPVMVYLDGD